MIYVGMDVSCKSFVVHAIDERKKLLFKGEIPPTGKDLESMLTRLGRQKKLVVFEAGNQLKWIALALRGIPGVEVYVVHPNEIKWINESSGKTDKVDARKLAHLARGDLLPRRVHIVEGKVRELRELISARGTLQSKRVALINTLRGYMLQEGHRLPEKFFTRKDWDVSLERITISDCVKGIIRSFMKSIASLQESERELSDRMSAIEDERITALESIPGIGALTARVLVSALDTVERFDNKKTVAKYGALTPTIYQSGTVTHMGHINRNGRHEVRRVLLQCAHTITRMRSYGATPLRIFYERIRYRRGKKKAVVALARKLLTIAYGVLKSGQHYDPQKLLPHKA
jgi:transposase